MAKHDPTDMPHHGNGRPQLRRVLVGAGVVGLAVALSACGGAKKEEAAAVKTSPQASASPAMSVVTIDDPWVKIPDEGMSMTGAFGVLKNTSDADVTVIEAISPVSPVMELHEVAMVDGKMSMREKEGGFVIPAKGSHELRPGADHIMLMDITKPFKVGDQVSFTLTVKDSAGKTQTMQFTAVAKPFVGAKESYAPGEHAGAQSPANNG